MSLPPRNGSLAAFVLFGGLLFWVDAANDSARADVRDPIVVPADVVDTLVDGWTRQSGRAPTATERDAIIEARVQEEVMVRQARELGLDRGDLVIRRRLVQKMDFLLDELAPDTPPTEDELVAWLDDHADDYRVPERRSLVQVYVSRDRHGDATEATARALLETLRTGEVSPEDARHHGDPSMKPQVWHQRSEARLLGDFGPELAAAAFSAQPGEWTGPHSSSFGQHLVFVTEVAPARVPALSEVRPEVEAAVEADRKAALRRQVVAEWGAAHAVAASQP